MVKCKHLKNSAQWPFLYLVTSKYRCRTFPSSQSCLLCWFTVSSSSPLRTSLTVGKISCSGTSCKWNYHYVLFCIWLFTKHSICDVRTNCSSLQFTLSYYHVLFHTMNIPQFFLPIPFLIAHYKVSVTALPRTFPNSNNFSLTISALSSFM